VAHDAVSLTGREPLGGLVRLTFPFKSAASARFTVRVGVELLSPTRVRVYLASTGDARAELPRLTRAGL
jgi:hypothetical protein